MRNFTRLQDTHGASLLAVTAALVALPGIAVAQEAREDQATVADEIVVTGTLLRGADVVGSNQIGIDDAKIEEIAPVSTNEILASVPQVTNYFNRSPLADLGGAGALNQIQIARPNLRNISPSNASSSATLILVDGHRIASAGVSQASVDPDAIPAGAIERVDVVTEGGSATYGADAVAGVINFITRRRFDGIEVNGHYGVADKYWQWDANATVGKDWGSGSIFASVTYAKTDALYGRDRDYIRKLNYTSQPYQGLDIQCENPNLSVNTVIPAFGVNLGSVNYAAPAFVRNTRNACDNGENSTYLPSSKRIGALAGLSQQLDDKTRIDVRAFWSRRDTLSSGDFVGTVPVGAGNPYASSLPAGLVLGPVIVNLPGVPFPIPAVNQAAVSFNLRPLLGDSAQHAGTRLEVWGVNAEVSRDLGPDWQLRGLFNFSASDTNFFLNQLSNTRLAAAGSGTTTGTAFNPFDVTQNNPALIADLTDSQIAGQSKDALLNLRLIAEGRLLTLPGGDVRLAVGYEFMHDAFQQRYQSDVRIGGLSAFPFNSYKRSVHSAFGELRVPILANKDGDTMLSLSGSARYDHYSDFGDTFNPKIGASFKPVQWITIRGNWGTSFTAPTPLDQLGSLRNTIQAFPFVPFTKPGETAPSGSFTVALQGSVPDLKPQKADTWSVGADLQPLDDLRLSASYYSVSFKDIIGTPQVDSNIVSNYPNNVITAPGGFTPAQLLAYGALAPGGTAVVQSLINSGTLVYEFVDFRVANYGALKVTGVDFSANYRHETGFGSFDLAVAGNRPLTRKAKVSATSPETDALATDNPKLYLQTSAGISVGGFRAQATWNYNGGYDIAPTNSVPVQDHVGSFSTVDLFFKYDVPSDSGVLQDLSFTLNVKNVLDTEPPVLRRSFTTDAGFANGFTLGRMFIVGASKKF